MSTKPMNCVFDNPELQNPRVAADKLMCPVVFTALRLSQIQYRQRENGFSILSSDTAIDTYHVESPHALNLSYNRGTLTPSPLHSLKRERGNYSPLQTLSSK